MSTHTRIHTHRVQQVGTAWRTSQYLNQNSCASRVAGVQMWDTLQYSDVVICRFLVSVSSAAKVKKKKAELQPRHTETEQVWALSWRGRGRAGQGLVGKKRKEKKRKRKLSGDRGRSSRGQSTFSHLYSPKVQSSSFIGWNSGSVCASSFSLTGQKRKQGSGESDGEWTESCVKLRLVS